MLVVSRQILGIFMARSEQGRVERFKQKGWVRKIFAWTDYIILHLWGENNSY